jgi:hypothetical protein
MRRLSWTPRPSGGPGGDRREEGEIGEDIAPGDLGREAVEPLAFGVGQEPDGHGGLLRGGLAPGLLANDRFREGRATRPWPRQIQVCWFSKSLLGMDFSGLYDYDEFRESRKE